MGLKTDGHEPGYKFPNYSVVEKLTILSGSKAVETIAVILDKKFFGDETNIIRHLVGGYCLEVDVVLSENGFYEMLEEGELDNDENDAWEKALEKADLFLEHNLALMEQPEYRSLCSSKSQKALEAYKSRHGKLPKVDTKWLAAILANRCPHLERFEWIPDRDAQVIDVSIPENIHVQTVHQRKSWYEHALAEAFVVVRVLAFHLRSTEADLQWQSFEIAPYYVYVA